MKHISFSIAKKREKNTASVKSREEFRAERIAVATAFIESTREQFSLNAARAKSRLSGIEAGVLAGPVARHR